VEYNRIEYPKITPHIYSQLIFDKGAKTHIGEETASSANGVGKLDSHM
jgi:hypothetical protein